MSLRSAQKLAWRLKQSLSETAQTQASKGHLDKGPSVASRVNWTTESLDISKPLQEQIHIPGKYQDYLKARKPRRLRDWVDQDTKTQIQKPKSLSLPEEDSRTTTLQSPSSEDSRKYRNLSKLSGRIRHQLESVLQEPHLQSVLKTSSWRLTRVEITSGVEGLIIYWVPSSAPKSVLDTRLDHVMDGYLKNYSGVIYKLLMQRMRVKSFPSRLTFKRDADQERSAKLESIFTDISKEFSTVKQD